MSERTRLLMRLWLPVLLWAGVIAGLSHIPHLKSPFRMDYLLRKTAHVLEYAVLAGLLARAFRGSGFEGRHLPLALLAAAVFAMTDEFHQNFVPGRYGTWKDFIFDMAGGLSGLIACRLGDWFRPRPDGEKVRTALPDERDGRVADPPSLPPGT